MRAHLSAFTVLALLLGAPRADALDLVFSAPATLTHADSFDMASHALPTGAFAGGRVEAVVVQAPLARAAYRIALASSTTTLDVMAALRAQVQSAGFDITFECAAQHCGGFDFRFALDLLPEPDMHVDLGDFRYLYAQRAARGEALALVVSRSPSFGFVHITKLGAFARPSPALTQATKSPENGTPETGTFENGGAATPSIIAQMQRGPHVLAGLTFTPGSADVQVKDGDVPDLAQWLAADSARVINLVGYTDTSGNTDDNLALSQGRADSLRAWMLAQYSIAPAQIIAIGRGAALPIAPNNTAAGRAQNRRVEAVLPDCAIAPAADRQSCAPKSR